MKLINKSRSGRMQKRRLSTRHRRLFAERLETRRVLAAMLPFEAGLIPGSVQQRVLNSEPATLAGLGNTGTIDEGAGPMAAVATVRRNGDLVNDLVVTLQSNDQSEILVPATVTIPAGGTEATFESRPTTIFRSMVTSRSA